jgi:hypothetical protein
MSYSEASIEGCYLGFIVVLSVSVCAQPLVSIAEECEHLAVPVSTLVMANVDFLETNWQADSWAIRKPSFVYEALVPARGIIHVF